LEALNPGVQVITFRERLTSKNVLEIISRFDVVLDGTDNFPTRYLVSDACVMLGKPYVYASVLRFEGRASTFGLPDGPCYRCLFPEPPPPDTVPNCSTAGVLGVMPGLLGVIQATEALKLLTGTGDTLSGRLLMVDGLRMRFREIAVRRDPACVACGTRTLREFPDYELWCAGPHADAGVSQMDPRELAARVASATPLDIVDVREPWEWGIARIEGARLIPLGTFDDLVGTLDPSRDLVLYCHHGTRSMAAATRLVQAGFQRVYNLRGGIDRWRRDVDPSMRAY
jgi:adenylyltransferase/sulfurtransferase